MNKKPHTTTNKAKRAGNTNQAKQLFQERKQNTETSIKIF